jgi:GDPmannose 4,6-dehydratase
VKKALITGITGQDGSYLAEFLLSKGYEVHGIIRRSSTFNTQRIDHIYIDPHEDQARFFLHYGDLADPSAFVGVINKVQPDEVYNLGAQSHVKVSFEMPEYTANTTGLGSLRILETLRQIDSNAKYYQASSSEMFGAVTAPQNELTQFYPRSPYAAAKVYSYWITVNYREAYGMFACNGILFNHESPRRGETFVTRKITRAIASILSGKQSELYLGNLHSKRDWGFAPEYVEMMWLMLQQGNPDDYVVGTGESHTIKEFAEKAFGYAGIEIEWRGNGENEVGIASRVDALWSSVKAGQVLVRIDPHYFRPTEVDHLQADITKAKNQLGWQPRVTFDELIKIMVDYDLKKENIVPIGQGLDICIKKDFNYTNHMFV